MGEGMHVHIFFKQYVATLRRHIFVFPFQLERFSENSGIIAQQKYNLPATPITKNHRLNPLLESRSTASQLCFPFSSLLPTMKFSFLPGDIL